MVIKKIILHNFLPFKDSILELKEDGVYNIIGKNGAGKSSIRDAITWCLFGKSRVEGAGDELIHNNEKEMYVVISLELSNKIYTITRKREKGQTTKLQIEENEIFKKS